MQKRIFLPIRFPQVIFMKTAFKFDSSIFETLLKNFFVCHSQNLQIVATKVRPPIEFLNLGVVNPLISQMPLSDNFFMNGKILDSTKFYKFGFHRKIVTQKNLPLQAFATSTLRNSI